MKLRQILLSLIVVAGAATLATAASCTTSVVGVAFGTYNPLAGTNVNSTGTVTVACSGVFGEVVSYAISLGTGSGTYTQRRMSNGGTVLGYNLYTNTQRTQVWGDGTGGTAVVSDSYTIHNQAVTKNYTVYGRIPGGQTQVTVGAYSDQVIVTVTY